MSVRPVAMADRVVAETVAELRVGPRKCSAHPPRIVESALTNEQRCNLQAKRRFVDRIAEVLGTEESIRDLALFFGVKKSTLHERMREQRVDLAPLDEWFLKLDRYEEFEKLTAEFARTA